jgi:diguanylate cyclase (GGDEF)-like protein
MWTTRRAVLAFAVIAALLVGGLAMYLLAAQRAARDDLRRGLVGRAEIAAKLTSGGLLAQGADAKTYARTAFSGPAKQIQASVKREQAADPQPRLLVLDARGVAIGADPASLRGNDFHADAQVARALHGKLGLSDVVETPAGSVFQQLVPFETRHGRRVLGAAFPLSLVSTFARGYLASAVGIDGAHAFLLDGSGRVLAADGATRIGPRLSDPAVLAALRDEPAGVIGGHDYASSRVPASNWRVLFQVPTEALLAPQARAQRVAWQMLGAFAFALLALLGIGATALNRSARLAHERQHDALTGLPNRSMFLLKTDAALSTLPRRGGHLAALFIDLDQFKPINDVHGHGVGDSLLTAVAERIQGTLRGDDIVSRFGGDEFLVLCLRLDAPDQAAEIAERIKLALTEPFDLAGTQLRVGCSIGIAVSSIEIEPIDAETLVDQADAAMYQAKQSGRDRISSFDPRLVTNSG